MTNEELKLITASNIINLRTSRRLTQAELGTVLNYSDKTVSKWERAEAIPDAYVLTRIADYFGVDVNYLLSSHDGWEMPSDEDGDIETLYDKNVIVAVALLGVLTASLMVFVILWLCGVFEWRILLAGATGMAIAFLVLDCIFYKHEHLKTALVLLICSVFVLIYFTFQEHKMWQIFLILGPAVALAILATKIRKKYSPIRRGK